MSEEPERRVRMDLPCPEGAVIVIVFSTVIVFSVSVALCNLGNYRTLPVSAIVLSVIWLLIVAIGMSIGIIVENGFRSFIVNRLATFSSQHFVEAFEQAESTLIVQFGFTLFTRRCIQFQIPATRIFSVEWSSGQATSLAGRDMDDWHVTVWYREPGSKRSVENGYRELSLHMVGRAVPQSEAAVTGRALVTFFESAGIAFYPSSNACIFTTQEASPGS